MIPWTATIAKLRTADGFWNIQPESGFNIGTELNIDFESREERKFVHSPTGKEFSSEVVTMLDKRPGFDSQYFPVELLDL